MLLEIYRYILTNKSETYIADNKYTDNGQRVLLYYIILYNKVYR
jgi:hypothetical protein